MYTSQVMGQCVIPMVRSVALSSDRKLFATHSTGESVRVWDSETGEAKFGGRALVRKPEEMPVYNLNSFVRPGQTFIECLADGITIKASGHTVLTIFWNAMTGERETMSEQHNQAPTGDSYLDAELSKLHDTDTHLVVSVFDQPPFQVQGYRHDNL